MYSAVAVLSSGAPRRRRAPALPALRPHDVIFTLPDGSRAVIIMASAFNAVGVLYDEGEDQFKRVADQYANLGLTDVRIFTDYNLPASGIGRCLYEDHPDLYDHGLPRTIELFEERRVRVWPVAYTSWNDPFHWPRLVVMMRGLGRTVYPSWVNELDQKPNRIDSLNRLLVLEDGRMGVLMPSGGPFIAHERPNDLVWSQGSNGSQADPPFPDKGRWFELHWNLAPEEQRKMGHNAAEYSSHIRKPAVGTETSRFPDGGGMWVEANTTHELVAYDGPNGGGLFAAYCCFHSVLGKKFALFDDQHIRVVKRWVAGAKNIPPDAPYDFPDDYIHRRDREKPGVVYPSGLSRGYEMRDAHTAPDSYLADIHGTYIPDDGPPPNPNPDPEPIPIPAPDPLPKEMAWIGVDSNEDATDGGTEGECVGEVDGMSDYDVISAYNGVRDADGTTAAWTRRAFERTVPRDRELIYWPDQNPRDKLVTEACLASIRVAAPQAHRIRYLFLDELDERFEGYLEPFERAWRAECGGLPPIIVNSTVPFLRGRSDAARAMLQLLRSAGHIPAFEAYNSPVHQDEPDWVQQARDIINDQRDFIGDTPCVEITESYRQTGQDGSVLKDNQLDSIVDEAFQHAVSDRWIFMVLCFVWSRKPNKGARQVGQWLIDSHLEWYRRLKAA